MRRYLVALTVAAAVLACHTDSVVAPVNPGTPGDAKNMAVGEVRVLTPSELPNGIELSTNTAATDYLIVVANTSSALDVPSSYVVKGDQFAGDIARAGDLLTSSDLSAGGRPADAQELADARIRGFERAHLVPSRAAGAGIAARNSLGISPIVAANVGDQVTIKVPNENASNLCDTYITTTGTVKAISNKATIVLDNQAANAFTTSDFTNIANEFDGFVYPTDSSYFGKPTDIDNNQHVILYYTPEVNKLTPRGQQSFIGGFFFAGDFFDPTKTVQNGGCPQSNHGEIFYLLAPDPTGQFSNAHTTATVRQGTRGTVAHEFQHMINAGNRIQSGAPAFESIWLDEGLAHTAEDAVGRAVRGFGDFQTLTDQDLFGNGLDQTTVDNYNAFFGQNLRRLDFWLARPDTSSGLSKNADANLSSRGAIWAFLRWTGDQYSGGNFRAYTRKLAAGPDTGVKNLTGVSAQPLDTLLAGWLVTNYSDHSGITGLATKYNYVGYNMRSAATGANTQAGGGYPLLVSTLSSGATISVSNMLPGTGTYYKVTVPAGGTRTIKVQDATGANVSFSGAHFYVLRID